MSERQTNAPTLRALLPSRLVPEDMLSEWQGPSTKPKLGSCRHRAISEDTMNIEELVDMAEWIHNDEGYNLGASSTRDERNAFWMRVVGCAYWGHPTYNPVPDPQWCVKDAGGGRPMSDDVAVSMPSRQAWDCIPGSGSDSYRFEADSIGILPADQHVYVPDKPAQDTPAWGALPPYPGDAAFDAIGVTLWADYAEAGRVPDSQVGRWFGRTTFDYLAGMSMNDSIAKHRAEWRTALGLD